MNPVQTLPPLVGRQGSSDVSGVGGSFRQREVADVLFHPVLRGGGTLLRQFENAIERFGEEVVARHVIEPKDDLNDNLRQARALEDLTLLLGAEILVLDLLTNAL